LTRLLLDGHISPALVRKLGEKGLCAEAVAHVGLSGEPDEHIWNYAFRGRRSPSCESVFWKSELGWWLQYDGSCCACHDRFRIWTASIASPCT